MFDEYSNIPILFIGSGFSKRYLSSFLTWDDLLNDSISKFDNSKYAKEKMLEDLEFETDFESKIKLAQEIETRFNSTFFKQKLINIAETDVAEIERKYDELQISPYKIFVALKFAKLEYKNSSVLKEEVKAFKKLSKNNLLSIITTNYDNLISDILEGYEELSGNKLILGEPENSILKIHGSVKDIESIIITEKDYKKFNNNNKIIQAKLMTYFLERPIIFLGYSLTDENIRTIIRDIFKSLTNNSAEYKKIENNFIFIEYKSGEEETKLQKNIPIQIEDISIHINKIETDNYLRIFQELEKIEIKTDIKSIKKFKKLIKTLVTENSNVEAKTIIREKDLNKINSEEVVVGFGLLDSKNQVVGFDFNHAVMLNYIFKNEEDQLLKSIVIFETYYIKKRYHGTNTRFPIYKLLNDIKNDSSIDYKEFNEKYSDIIKKYCSKYDKLIKDILAVGDGEINDIKNLDKKNLMIAKKYLEGEITENELVIFIGKAKSIRHKKNLMLIYDYKKYKI